MSKQTEPGSAFAPASGYATVEVALAWAEGTRVLSREEYEILQGKEGFESGRADRKASIILASEVRRLRALLKRGRDMLNTPASAPLEEWPSEPEIDAFVAECDAVLGQSHNNAVSDGANTGGSNV